MAFVFDMVQAATFGLIANPVATRDQVKNLANDNVVAEDANGFADLGITPSAMDAVLPDYLWRFRPSGQYAAITNCDLPEWAPKWYPMIRTLPVSILPRQILCPQRCNAVDTFTYLNV